MTFGALCEAPNEKKIQVDGTPLEVTPVVERGDHFWVSTLLCFTDVRSEQEVGVYDNIYATNLNQRDVNPNSVH